MKGDFSRISFDPSDHFSRVLLQQGRVTLDADPNEGQAILLHYLRTLARDLIGPCGGPADRLGFELLLDRSGTEPRLSIAAGRYYVDGVLVENEVECEYGDQPDYTPAADDPVFRRLKNQLDADVWLYLDVWERHITWIEDDSIRESALGGPDTCTRARVTWQVRAIARDALLTSLQAKRDQVATRLAGMPEDDPRFAALSAHAARLDAAIAALDAEGETGKDCRAPIEALLPISTALMTARLQPGAQSKDPCVISPEASYRGAENQLYRVEVHRASAPGVTPTFKWSRDNGSVAARWLESEGDDLIVSSARGFEPGVWVELSDEANELSGQPGMLVKLTKVQGDRLSVDPDSVPEGKNIALFASAVSPKVRRWDQAANDDIQLTAGAVPLLEAAPGDPRWIDLEDGVQVQFAADGSYRSGDYWLIPARVATGSIEWPNVRAADGSTLWEARAPHGVGHHYAPLGFLGPNSDGDPEVSPCTCEIQPINSCGPNLRVRKRVAPIKTPKKPPK
ncbi:MAG TPA: DUF6519 domain-containing protein [Polyangiales bacterium]|nr:DUF6519 domain-containing protein [Polyangiales bacterium]